MQLSELPSPFGKPGPIAHSFSYASLSPDDAAKLRRTAEAIRSHGKRIGHSIIAVGELLLAVKAGLAHGDFGRWLETEFGWSERTAQRYMQVAEAFAEKTDTVSLLPPTTLYQLAAPSTPAPVRLAVVERLERHEPLPVDAIRDMVRDAKDAEKAARTEAKLTAEEKARRKRAADQRQRQIDRGNAKRAFELDAEIAARREAAALIMQKMGDDIDALAVLLDTCRCIYASDIRSALRTQASAQENAQG